MADAEHGLQFFERGVRMFFNVCLKFLGVELAPSSPTGFRRQRILFGGVQIPVNGTPGQRKTPGGLGLGAAALNEFHHPLSQVQRIGFHARELISLCPNVNMKCYSVEKVKQAAAQGQPLPDLADLLNAAKFFCGRN